MHGCQRRDAPRGALFLLATALLAAGSIGCADFHYAPYDPAPLSQVAKTATVLDLASRVGLVIVESAPHRATLRRGDDVVMLFSEPGGQAYVNGRPIDVPGGGHITVGPKSVRFPPALIGAIASAMPKPRPVAPPRPPARPAVRTRPQPRPLGLGRVVIDAGHGGVDVGTDAAVRLYGIRLYEKTVNLSIARAVANMLRLRGADVHMTRDNDAAVSLDSRVYMANHLKPKLFMSIHANSLGQTSRRGFMVLRPAAASADSLAAAATVERHLAAIGMDGEVRKDVRGLRVLRKTTCPAILVETAYLSNRADARMLATSQGRTRIATALANAVTEFLTKRARSGHRVSASRR